MPNKPNKPDMKVYTKNGVTVSEFASMPNQTPGLEIYSKDGAAYAQLVTPTAEGSRTFVVVMKPGEVSEVRKRVEAMAKAHNVRVGEWVAGASDEERAYAQLARSDVRGAADDDVLPMGSGTPQRDPDEVLAMRTDWKKQAGRRPSLPGDPGVDIGTPAKKPTAWTDPFAAPAKTYTLPESEAVVVKARVPHQHRKNASGMTPMPSYDATKSQPRTVQLPSFIEAKLAIAQPKAPTATGEKKPWWQIWGWTRDKVGYTVGQDHCLQRPDGTIVRTRIVHCNPSRVVAGCACAGDVKAMTKQDVDGIAGAHIRSALLGRMKRAVPPKYLARAAALDLKARGFRDLGDGRFARAASSALGWTTEIGVTGFRSPPEHFVDDAYHEEQMERAGKDGRRTLDDFRHDAMFGEDEVGFRLSSLNLTGRGSSVYRLKKSVKPGRLRPHGITVQQKQRGGIPGLRHKWKNMTTFWRETPEDALAQATAYLEKGSHGSPYTVVNGEEVDVDFLGKPARAYVGVGDPDRVRVKLQKRGSKWYAYVYSVDRTPGMLYKFFTAGSGSRNDVRDAVRAYIDRRGWTIWGSSVGVEAIEEGVVDGLRPYSRGEILDPSEVMQKPDGWLEDETILEQDATPPKVLTVTPHVVEGADGLPEIAGDIGETDEERVLRMEHETPGAWEIRGEDDFIGSVLSKLKKRAGKVARGAYKYSGAKAVAKGTKKYGSKVAKGAYKYSGAKAVTKKVAALTKSFVPSRDAKKKKLVADLYKTLVTRFSKYDAYKRGSKKPSKTELNRAALSAKKLIMKHGLPLTLMGWSTSGMALVRRSDWERGAESATVGFDLYYFNPLSWFRSKEVNALYLAQKAAEERKEDAQKLTGLTAETRRKWEEVNAIEAALARDVQAITQSKAQKPQIALTTANAWVAGDETGDWTVMGAWWNPFSWHFGRAKKVMAEADLLAPDVDSLPALPEGAEGTEGQAPTDGDGSAEASPGLYDGQAAPPDDGGDGGGEVPADDGSGPSEADVEAAEASAEEAVEGDDDLGALLNMVRR